MIGRCPRIDPERYSDLLLVQPRTSLEESHELHFDALLLRDAVAAWIVPFQSTVVPPFYPTALFQHIEMVGEFVVPELQILPEYGIMGTRILAQVSKDLSPGLRVLDFVTIDSRVEWDQEEEKLEFPRFIDVCGGERRRPARLHRA